MKITTKEVDALKSQIQALELKLHKKQIDFENLEASLEAKFKREVLEKEALYEKTVNDLILKHEKDLSNFERKLREEHYKKFQDELAKLHTEGNSQTKFIQDIALKMVEKAPQQKVLIESHDSN